MNTNYSNYSFISNSQKGNVNLMLSDITLNKVDFKASSGNVYLRLNRSNIKEDFEKIKLNITTKIKVFPPKLS